MLFGTHPKCGRSFAMRKRGGGNAKLVVSGRWQCRARRLLLLLSPLPWGPKPSEQFERRREWAAGRRPRGSRGKKCRQRSCPSEWMPFSPSPQCAALHTPMFSSKRRDGRPFGGSAPAQQPSPTAAPMGGRKAKTTEKTALFASRVSPFGFLGLPEWERPWTTTTLE